MSSMCMYQGLGQMLTMCLQHHQGCSEAPKCAYVIYGQPLMPLIMHRCVCNTDGCNHSYLEGAVRSGGVEVAGAALITGVMALLLARL